MTTRYSEKDHTITVNMETLHILLGYAEARERERELIPNVTQEVRELIEAKQKKLAAGPEWRCPLCGGPNLDIQAWVNVNTDEMGDWDHSSSTFFCNDCDEHVQCVEVNDYRPEGPAPDCGHSACRQHWIETGVAECCMTLGMV